MTRYTILWSPLAEKTYLKTLSQILKKWTIKEAENFEFKVDSLLNRLQTQKNLCPPSFKNKNLRRCVITSQTSVVYQIKGSYIEIVAFFDNRSNQQY